MPTVTFGPSIGTNQVIKAQRVYYRADWGDGWTETPGVFCLRASFCASPSMPEATLYYRYGVGKLAGESAIAEQVRLDWPSLAWVKVEFDVYTLGVGGAPTVVKWYGIAAQIVDDVDGDRLVIPSEDPPVAKPSGVQKIVCVGLDWVLERAYLENGKWDAADPTLVFSAPSFAYPKDATDSIFASSGSTTWNTRACVEYLVDLLNVTNVLPAVTLSPFDRWAIADETLLPDWDDPNFATQGFSYGSLFKRLLGRQRGLSYTIEVVEGGAADDTDQVVIRPFTFTDVDVEIVTGKSIEANPNVYDLSLLADPSGGLATVRDSFARYKIVRAIGARATTVYTVSNESLTLEPSWDNTQENDYLNGAAALPGFPPETELDKRVEAYNQYRDQVQFHNVYRHFLVDTEATYTGDLAGASLAATGAEIIAQDPDASDKSYPADKYLLDYVPFIDGIDYTVGGPLPIPPAVLRVFSTPKAYFQVDGTSQWVAAENIARYGRRAGLEGWDFSAEVRPDQKSPYAFELVVTGKPKEVINTPAGGRLKDLAYADAHEYQKHTWDYTKALFTIARELDHYCEAVAIGSGAGAADLQRAKVIQAGPSYRLDRAALYTVVGVSATGSLITTGTRTDHIVDDRPRLAEIAYRALQWYGVDRSAITFGSSWVNGVLKVGYFITDLISADSDIVVNAPITDIVFEWPINVAGLELAPPKVTYQTTFAELDFIGGSL